MMPRLVLLLSVFSSAVACEVADADGNCPVGAESCACTAAGACDPGLMCLSQTCVDAGGGEGTDAGGSEDGASEGEGEGESEGDPSSASEGEASSSGGEDPCVAAGGELYPNGFCEKGCTVDEESPGYDLFGDCLPLDMVCRPVFERPSLCKPADWGVTECTSDDECQPGGKCVRYSGVGEPYAYCEIACEESGPCPTGFSCVTSCPNGAYDKLEWCTWNGVATDSLCE